MADIDICLICGEELFDGQELGQFPDGDFVHKECYEDYKKETTVETKLTLVSTDDNKMIVNALSNQGYKTVDEARKENIVNIQDQSTKWNSDHGQEITTCCYCARLCYLDHKETWCEHAVRETFHTEFDGYGEDKEYEVHGILFSFDKTKIPVFDSHMNSTQWCRCPKCDYVNIYSILDVNGNDHSYYSCKNCQYENFDGDDMRHCIGAYAIDEYCGYRQHFAIHDSTGKMIATGQINSERKYLCQMYGPCNQSLPVPFYKKIQDILHELELIAGDTDGDYR